MSIWRRLAGTVCGLLAAKIAFFSGRGLPLLWPGGPGWRRLAREYPPPTDRPLPPFRHWQTVQAGAVLWRRCISVAVTQEGLWLWNRFPGMAGLTIPWTAVTGVRPAMLYWRRAYDLLLDRPAGALVRLQQSVYAEVAPHLGGRAGGQAKPAVR